MCRLPVLTGTQSAPQRSSWLKGLMPDNRLWGCDWTARALNSSRLIHSSMASYCNWMPSLRAVGGVKRSPLCCCLAAPKQVATLPFLPFLRLKSPNKMKQKVHKNSIGFDLCWPISLGHVACLGVWLTYSNDIPVIDSSDTPMKETTFSLPVGKLQIASCLRVGPIYTSSSQSWDLALCKFYVCCHGLSGFFLN